MFANRSWRIPKGTAYLPLPFQRKSHLFFFIRHFLYRQDGYGIYHQSDKPVHNCHVTPACSAAAHGCHCQDYLPGALSSSFLFSSSSKRKLRRMMYRIIRPPVLFLYSSVITRATSPARCCNPKTVCLQYLFQIITNHDNPFLYPFPPVPAVPWLPETWSHPPASAVHRRETTQASIAAQSVFSVNILKGRFFPVRYTRNSVTFLMQLLQYFPCIFNKLRCPRFLCIINLEASSIMCLRCL